MARHLSGYIFVLVLTIAAHAAPLGVDLNGKPVQQLALPDTRVVVLFFAASDCPISNRYIPEISRLRNEFAAQHVVFWWVFPNPEDTSEIVKRHQQQFSIGGKTILDTKQTLVRLAHVNVTPESAVFSVVDGHLREVYHGRVDDRYISLGQERPRPTRDDLEQAIADALAGKPVDPSVTRPVGCSIVPLTAVQ